jgi:hypothetical protein
LVRRDRHPPKRGLILRLELTPDLVEAFRLQERASVFLKLAQGALSNGMPDLAALYASSSARCAEEAVVLARRHPQPKD